jgi:hypothetical protein
MHLSKVVKRGAGARVWRRASRRGRLQKRWAERRWGVVVVAHPLFNRPRKLWRAVAGLATGLMLFLVIASVCPSLHELCCHHHDHSDAAGSTCVVFTFSDGVILTGAASAPPAPIAFLIPILPTCGTRSCESAGAWLTPPVCGPPSVV